MKKKIKGQAALVRKLRAGLRYWQMNGRIYRRWVRDANDKCKEIAAKMREIQNDLPT